MVSFKDPIMIYLLFTQNCLRTNAITDLKMERKEFKEDKISVQHLEANLDTLHAKLFRVIKYITKLADDVVLLIINNPKQLF